MEDMQQAGGTTRRTNRVPPGQAPPRWAGAETDRTRNPSERCESQAQAVFGVVGIACLLTAALSAHVGSLHLRVALALLVVGPLGLGLVALLDRLLRCGNSPIPRWTFLAGVLFMAGGTAFDIAVTVASSPRLTNEANPIVRTLIEAGFSTPSIYMIGVIGQWALLAAGTLAWAIVFQHRAAVIRSAWAAQPTSAAQFIRAALTGRLVPAPSVRGYVHGFELPRAYHLLSVLGVCLPAGWFGRWCLGFQWLGVLQRDDAAVAAVVVSGVTLAFVAYLSWLRSAYEDGRMTGELLPH